MMPDDPPFPVGSTVWITPRRLEDRIDYAAYEVRGHSKRADGWHCYLRPGNHKENYPFPVPAVWLTDKPPEAPEPCKVLPFRPPLKKPEP